MATEKPIQTEAETLTEALLGKRAVDPNLFFMKWPGELRAALAATLLGIFLFVPYLGAVGLWDPWETHYGEVAREMIQRNDYVHPYWENAWFFSKPAFTMWMQAFGLQLAQGGTVLALVLGALLLGGGGYLFAVRGAGGKHLSQFWGVVFGLCGGLGLFLGALGTSERLPWRFASVAEGDGALPLFTEWGFRLPFAGFSILALALLAYALARLINVRVAVATVFVLATMPMYFLLSRQAVTDTPVVSAMICGFCCALVALFDPSTRHRSEWWYAAYVFFGIGTLAKGWMAFLMPGAVFAVWLVVCKLPGRREELMAHVRWVQQHLASPLGSSLAAAVVVGFVARSLGQANDTTFISGPPRAGGLPGQGNDYLSAPDWLGLTWGALAFWVALTVLGSLAIRRLKERPPALWEQLISMRVGTGVLLFLAVCLPWYYEMFTFWRVDDESKLFWFRFIVHDHLSRFFSGVHTTTPGGNFTYFIEQGGYAMFPWVLLVPGALGVTGGLKVRSGQVQDQVGLIAVAWFLVAWFMVGGSATKFHHYVFPMLPPLAILMGIYVDKVWREGLEAHGATLLFGLPLAYLVSKDLSGSFKNFTDLFVYNYDRPYPAFLTERPILADIAAKVEAAKGLGTKASLSAWEQVQLALLGSSNVKGLFGSAFTAFVGVGALFALLRSKTAVFALTLVGALTWAVWFNWSHWVDLSHHWTQRDQFWRYYTQRNPGEPIAAFLMNWRGETFYSRNTVKQIKDNPGPGMFAYGSQPGREWSLVEHARLGVLKQSLPPDKRVTLVDKDLNNKFVLVTIE